MHQYFISETQLLNHRVVWGGDGAMVERSLTEQENSGSNRGEYNG